MTLIARARPWLACGYCVRSMRKRADCALRWWPPLPAVPGHTRIGFGLVRLSSELQSCKAGSVRAVVSHAFCARARPCSVPVPRACRALPVATRWPVAFRLVCAAVFSPLSVAPYQTEERDPSFTSPRTLALGAMKTWSPFTGSTMLGRFGKRALMETGVGADSPNFGGRLASSLVGAHARLGSTAVDRKEERRSVHACQSRRCDLCLLVRAAVRGGAGQCRLNKSLAVRIICSTSVSIGLQPLLCSSLPSAVL